MSSSEKTQTPSDGDLSETRIESQDCEAGVQPDHDSPLKASIFEINVFRRPKGQRADPRKYIQEHEIEAHLAKFDDGAVVIVKKKAFEDIVVELHGAFGRNDGVFVMPKYEVEEMLSRTGGDPRLLEKELGFPPYSLKAGGLVRLDIANPRELNLRMPSGNEEGTNERWIPGGKLPTGNDEAVIDQLPAGSYKVTQL